MVKCAQCHQEIRENWVEFQNLKIEVNFTQEQNGKMFSEIEIPEGQRMLRYEELNEVMNYIIENKLNIWSFFEQPIKSFEGKYVAMFVANSDGVYFNCGRNPQGLDAGLGCIFCREIEK